MLTNLRRKAPAISKMLSNRVAMTATTAIRMSISLGVFVLLARSLGPKDYGFITTVLAYAALVGLVTDFGFSIKTMRDIAATPADGGSILAASLSVKALLVGSVCLVGGLVIALSPLAPATKIAAAMLAAGLLIGSIGDLATVSYRGLGRFWGETWMVTWTSAAYGVIVGAIAFLQLDVVAVAAGYLASRLIYLGVALVNVQRLFPHHPLRVDGFRDILLSMRRTASWAIDNGLGFVNAQFASLVLAHSLGLTAAGEYQSGDRFAQGAFNTIGILTNIHITALAALPKSKAITRREIRMVAEFAAAGAFFASLLYFGGHFISTTILGAKYKSVDALWPGFAVFVQIRFISGAFASALTARAQPIVRVCAQLTGLLTLILGFAFVVPRFGLTSVAWMMAAGSFTQALAFFIGRLGWLEAAFAFCRARVGAPLRAARVASIDVASAGHAQAIVAPGAASSAAGERHAASGGAASSTK